MASPERGRSYRIGEVTLAAAVCLERTDDVARLLREASAEDRQLALEAAAFNGKSQEIGRLIGLGADVNVYNIRVQYHAAPLHNAVCSGSFQAVKMLVEAGAKLDTKDGYPAVVRAIEFAYGTLSRSRARLDTQMRACRVRSDRSRDGFLVS